MIGCRAVKTTTIRRVAMFPTLPQNLGVAWNRIENDQDQKVDHDLDYAVIQRATNRVNAASGNARGIGVVAIAVAVRLGKEAKTVTCMTPIALATATQTIVSTLN